MVAALVDDNRIDRSRMRVLIGESDAHSARVLNEAFPRQRFEVHLARDADHVVEIVAYVPIDLYFIDLNIPHMGGIATLKLIRQIRRPVHCVLTLDRGSKESLLEAAEADAFTHIRKPFDLDEVQFVIRRFLKKFYG